MSTFELSVVKEGKPIAPADLRGLLAPAPFYRDAVWPSPQGPNLDLYIAHEIEPPHDGKVEMVSTSAETRFTFRMPALFIQEPAKQTPTGCS